MEWPMKGWFFWGWGLVAGRPCRWPMPLLLLLLMGATGRQRAAAALGNGIPRFVAAAHSAPKHLPVEETFLGKHF